jgi:filamentous hemagglutinin family protein
MRNGAKQQPVKREPALGRVTRQWLAGLGAGLSVGLVQTSALAEPTGGEVLMGEATVSQTGSHTRIETQTQRTRIAWDNFDIGVDESVHIAQPGHYSATLNDVLDAAVTNVDGTLTSNGQVWIRNPAGVYFGGAAVVDVASLVAAAGEISDQAFVFGEAHVTNLVGEVRNDGSLFADSIVLLGRAVANHGQIVTRGGDIVMAAGDEIVVTGHDTHIRVHMPHANPTAPSVENSGLLDAGGGRARLAAGDFLGIAIRNSGQIRAAEIALEAGAESVVDVGGTLDASNTAVGAKGGRIKINGDWILVDDATLDASGAAGGGEILLGVDGNPHDDSARLARGTFVSADSTLRADSLGSGSGEGEGEGDGDGGEIAVWSDEITQVMGSLSAEGGPQGGDGGFIETSSRGRLDVGALVSVAAPQGQPGTWLIDPVNVAVVPESELDMVLDANPIDEGDLNPLDPTAPKPIELFEFNAAGSVFFQPLEPHPDEIQNPDVGPSPPNQEDLVPLNESLVSSESLEAALRRGGTVIVSTEAIALNLATDDVGYIEVRDAIEIEASDDVRPDTNSTLLLLAADDVRVQQRIASDNPDVTLSLTMRANDNQILSGAGGQPENASPLIDGQDRRRIGNVEVTAPIRTMGGNVSATGTNIDLAADIDTRSPDPETNGGFVNVFGVDLATTGFVPGDADTNNEYGNVTVAGTIQTGGGAFLTGGELLTISPGSSIDAFRQSPSDPEQSFGLIQAIHISEVVIDADMRARTVLLTSGAAGVGDLRLGSAASTPLVRGNQIQLTAGDGVATPNGGGDARVIIDPGVRFEDPTDATAPPEVFTFTQDAFIRDVDLPGASQFGGGSMSGALYAITSLEGDATLPDIRIETPDKFADADLVLVAPDSIEVGPLFADAASPQPRNVELIFEEGVTITQASGISNLMPAGDPDDDDEGFLRIHAARSGTGDLDFEDGVILTAPKIALRAGDPDLIIPGDNGVGVESMVNPGTAEFRLSSPPTQPGVGHSFEIRQDASVTDANIPDPENVVVEGNPRGDLSGIDYSILSEGGTITLTDPDQVLATDVTLTARDSILLESPISVHSADLGGFSGFQVTEDLLDNVVINSGSDARVLTLRSGSGGLTFQSTKIDDNGNSVDVQLRVEAERIELNGATINVNTGSPLFQRDDATSPERLIFRQAGQIGDAVLPTVDNYPDGIGPSELFVAQSSIGVGLVHEGLDERGWIFPVGPQADVVIAGPGVQISRTDGFDLVFGDLDQIWGTDVTLRAIWDGLGHEPIGGGSVDAAQIGSVRGFDSTIDYTADTFDPPENAVGSFAVDQDDDFELRSGIYTLPDFGGPPDPGGQFDPLEFQPARYVLISQEGSIEVDNLRLADTNLELSVDSTEGEFIDFDNGSTLAVTSLVAQMGGDFEVGGDASGSDGATIVAEDGVILVAGLFGEGSLSFAPNVDITINGDGNLLLQAGIAAGPDDIVDARTNDPIFDVSQLQIFQGGDVRNGLDPVDPTTIDYGQLPATNQLRRYVRGTNPLKTYIVETRIGDIEINDPREVLVARTVQLFAGTTDDPTNLTLRAEVQALPTSPCVTTCGDATLPQVPDPNNLILIEPGSGVAAVALRAQQVRLEAPRGYVDAGDERVLFQLLGDSPALAIRQSDPILRNQGARLPDSSQFVGGLDTAVYLIQALEGLELGAELADRVDRSNLVLSAGLLEEDFESTFGADRLGDPVPDDDPELPDHVYDRFSDLNGDGTVDDLDRTIFEGLTPAAVAIEDDEAFELVLNNLDIQSTPDDGAPIRLGSVHVQTESDQIYRDQVLLVGQVVDPGEDPFDPADDFIVPTELTARAGLLTLLNPTLTSPAASIIFEHEIDAQTPGGESLIANATNRIRFLEQIGTNTRLGSLTINLEQLLQLQNPPPIPRAEFGSEDFFDVVRQSDDFQVIASEILLNPGDGESRFSRDGIPHAATFFSNAGGLTFDVGTGGTFAMGLNEKLAVDGSSLRILAPDGDVAVGDLSALDLIRIDTGAVTGSGAIHLLRREGGDVIRANGEVVKDLGVDFVAREIELLFSFDPASDPTGSATLHANQLGGGKDARFGVEDSINAPAFLDDFSVLGLQFNLLGGEGLGFLGGNLVLDGVPDGISRISLAESYADHRPLVPIALPAVHRVRDPARLQDIGVSLRTPTPDELRAAAGGAATFHDLGSMKAIRAGELDVSEVRLVSSEIELAAELHDEVFGADGSRAPQVREVFQAAVDDYRRSTGTRRIVGFELRRYVYNRPSSQFHAYQELQKLDALFRHHRRSGLSPTEYSAVQKRWLETVRPEGISLRELAEFVHPSRYVRGSDVLDVFGD